ncbi:MAG: arylsulfatase, partial [Rubripirellula sp.]
CSTIDILPTVAKLIGAELPSHKIDGHDIRPLIFGEEGAESPHESFYCYYGGGQLQAVRNDRFKLVFPHSYRTLKGHPGGTGGLPIQYQQEKAKLSLYDLDNDVSETKNVMADYPEVVAELNAAAERARQDLGDKLQKRTGSGVRPAGKMEASDERLPLIWR